MSRSKRLKPPCRAYGSPVALAGFRLPSERSSAPQIPPAKQFRPQNGKPYPPLCCYNLARSLLHGVFAAAAELAGAAALDGYRLFPGVRVGLLMKMGRLPEAREEFERAVDMA